MKVLITGGAGFLDGAGSQVAATRNAEERRTGVKRKTTRSPCSIVPAPRIQ